MRAGRFWCGVAVAVAVAAGVAGTALASDEQDAHDTIEFAAPAEQRAEIVATLAAVAADLPE